MAGSSSNSNKSVWIIAIVTIVAALITGVFTLFEGFGPTLFITPTDQQTDLASPTTEEVDQATSETPTSTPEATATPGATPPNSNCSFTAEDQITVSEVNNGHTYTFSANAGDVITLEIMGIGDTANPGFFLHDPSGAQIASSRSSSTSERLDSFILSATGQYRLNVVSNDRPMAYTVTLNCSQTNAAYPPPPSTLTCGNNVNTEISVAQRNNGHTYTFSADARDVITLEIVGVGDTANPGFFLYDPGSAQIASSRSSNTSERLDSFILSATGQYRLNVVSNDRPMAYTVTLNCSQTNAAYPPPPSTLTCGNNVNTEISVAQRNNGHTYTFSADARDVITLEIVGVGDTANPGFFLYDPGSAQIASSRSSSTSERLDAFVLQATGQHRLNVVSNDRPMAYALSLQCIGGSSRSGSITPAATP
jgi:predicted  nucleic acid-binding Zn-ribbon protein